MADFPLEEIRNGDNTFTFTPDQFHALAEALNNINARLDAFEKLRGQPLGDVVAASVDAQELLEGGRTIGQTHGHGNITWDGKVGSIANKPLITGTGGTVQAGSFGNSANTFCQGNDSRLGLASSALQAIVAASGSHIGDVGTPSVIASTDTTLKKTTLTFNYLKGAKGDPGTNGTNGTNGTSAGFGTPTASVDANIGTPSVMITASGPDTAKVFNFEFKNLKGATGPAGPAAYEWVTSFPTTYEAGKVYLL